MSSNPTPPPGASPDPAELLRSRSYLALLVFGAAIGVPVATAAYFFLKGVDEAQDYLYTTLPGELGFDGAPMWWPLPLLALSGLIVAARNPLPAGNGRSLARGRIQIIRAGSTDRAAGHRHRGLRHAQPRGGARARGPADRDRQRPWRAGGAPDQARRPRSGEHGDRGSGEFRGHQHSVGVADRRSVSDDGSVRARRRHAGSRAGPGSARRRRRLAHLRGAGFLDRFRDVFARRPEHSARRLARRRPVPLGARDRRRRSRAGALRSAPSPSFSGPSWNAGCCSSHQLSGSRSGGWRSPSPRDRTGAPRRCSSPARMHFRR